MEIAIITLSVAIIGLIGVVVKGYFFNQTNANKLQILADNLNKTKANLGISDGKDNSLSKEHEELEHLIKTNLGIVDGSGNSLAKEHKEIKASVNGIVNFLNTKEQVENERKNNLDKTQETISGSLTNLQDIWKEFSAVNVNYTKALAKVTQLEQKLELSQTKNLSLSQELAKANKKISELENQLENELSLER